MNSNESEKYKKYKEYKLARDSIQLVNAYVINCCAELFAEMDSKSRCEMSTQIGKKQERISDTDVNGYIKVEVIIKPNGEDRQLARFMVECKGLFHVVSRDVETKEQDYRINLQLVPQLLPYVRMALTNLSSMLNIAPIILPTIDIIRSIEKNR